MAQTSYSLDHDAATPGQLVDGQSPIMTDTKTVETAAGIGMGLVVSQGTADGGCVVGGTNVLGITYRNSQAGDATTYAAEAGYQREADLLVMGRVWVTTYDTVTVTTAPLYNTTTGAIGGGTPEAGEAALTGARFCTAASATGLVQIEFIKQN